MNLTADSATNIRLRAFLLGVTAPLAVLVLSLKSLRVFGLREFENLPEALSLYRSDCLLLLLFYLFGSAALVVLRKHHATTQAAFQAAAILWACIETIAHQFYVATGSTIDFGIFLFSIQRLGDTAQVFLSETPLLLVILLVEVVAVILFLPRYIIRRPAPTADPKRMGGKSQVAIGSVLLISSAWSVLPVSQVNNPGFSRSNLINFAFSMVRMDQEITGGEVTRESLMTLSLGSDNPQAERKNLVIVILESTRASATTPYNGELPTTPFLNSLKEKSLFVERAYAVMPHTSKALVALLCGVEPHLTMPITEATEDGIPAPCLPRLLAETGYRSVFFQSATQSFEARDGLVQNLGFDEFFPLERLDQEGMEPANYFGVEDAVMLAGSREWLTANAEQGPFLATYLTSTPHHDYLAPRQRYGFQQFSTDDEFNRYLNSVHYVDQFSRELFEQYQAMGLDRNTLFVFVGDHGEAFGEHGRNQHDNILWEEGLHVPLLIFDPRSPIGKRITRPVNQLDLLPTLTNLLGYTLAGAQLPGQSFWSDDPQRKLFAHCWYELNCMAVIDGSHKYIEHFGRRNNEYFDLLSDQAESSNRHADLDSDRIEHLRRDLFSWRRAVNGLYQKSAED
ncbi:MAG: sulfatase-like hydrolase/transferase [Gammaproteobacteria bacterium]|nr:sulfatase-like hydrolase/transferase [Pseudomonadales bacterium]MCP5348250.1 sulfatase-like hydrolase/transferase [Pseudomonadales bacterium]